MRYLRRDDSSQHWYLLDVFVVYQQDLISGKIRLKSDIIKMFLEYSIISKMHFGIVSIVKKF